MSVPPLVPAPIVPAVVDAGGLKFTDRVLTSAQFRDWYEHANKNMGGVCRITNTKLSTMGSGFHYGSGWVVTNSHVIAGKDALDPNADLAHFKFDFPDDKSFDGHDRLAIIVPINEPGVPDIALIKLGSQRDYGRKIGTMQGWECKEQELTAKLVALSEMELVEANVGALCYVIHYGAGEASMSQQVSMPGKIECFDRMTFTHAAHTREGSSGSPVFVRDNSAWQLAGVTVEGDPEHDRTNLAVNIRVGSTPPAGYKCLELMRTVMVEMETLLAYDPANCADSSPGATSTSLQDDIISSLRAVVDQSSVRLHSTQLTDHVHVYIPLSFLSDELQKGLEVGRGQAQRLPEPEPELDFDAAEAGKSGAKLAHPETRLPSRLRAGMCLCVVPAADPTSVATLSCAAVVPTPALAVV